MPFYNSRRKEPVRTTSSYSQPAAAQHGQPPNVERRDLDLIDQEPLPLDEAAQELEMGKEELLKAFRAGDYRGFVDEGTLYIYVPERTPEPAAPHRPTTPTPMTASDEPDVQTEPVQDAQPQTGATQQVREPQQAAAQEEDVSPQEQEIERLRKVNRELKDEKDRLFRLLEREQVLRQGIQRTLDRAWSNLLPPAEAPEKLAEAVQTIDRYAKEPEAPSRRPTREDEPLDIGSFLGRHD